jgi:hypothetical protein
MTNHSERLPRIATLVSAGLRYRSGTRRRLHSLPDPTRACSNGRGSACDSSMRPCQT